MSRFHVLGIPHTATSKRWLCCAYTQKVLKLCAMLHARGHHVVHYGNEESEVSCSEHVPVTARADIGEPEHYLEFDLASPCYRAFAANAIRELASRKQLHDFLLCPFGYGHKLVADAHSDMIVVESGIGYAGPYFARWKIFESYAILHAHYGMQTVTTPGLLGWYDAVIPNYFDPADFDFVGDKRDYLLFLGRINAGKGIHVAIELAEKLGALLVVAGPGEPVQASDRILFVGIADELQRRELLAHARALIAPSLFLEPFCGVTIEAAMSGTPVITADWGAFAENVVHGVTGYRCRTFEQFLWAAQHIDRIRPSDCRCWAEMNFSIERVGEMYEEFFRSVTAVYTGNGWYEPNPQRSDLDWLTRRYPPLFGSSPLFGSLPHRADRGAGALAEASRWMGTSSAPSMLQ